MSETMPYQTHSPTSADAAVRAETKVTGQRALILDLLRKPGETGWTDDEMQRWLAMDPSTQRPRRVELVRSGHVVDSGRTRATRSGRQATVWVAAEFAAKEAT